MKTTSPSNRKVQLAFGSAIAILLVVGALSYRGMVVSNESDRWVWHTYDVIDVLQDLLAAMQSVESSYRGFVLTGNESFLKAYRAGISETRNGLATARKLTADNPEQQHKLTVLESLAARKIQLAEKATDLRRTQGLESAVEAIRTEQVKPIMDDFQDLVRELRDEELRLLTLREADAKRRVTHTKIAVIFGALLALLITTAAAWSARRDSARRGLAEAKYRGLLEAAPDAMVVVNPRGEIVLLNLQAEKQFGYSRDELLGQQVKNIIPQGFAERLHADGLRSAADALAQQIGTGIELTARRKDGSEFPIEIMLSPLESAEGVLVTAAIRDITERHHSDEEIRETKTFLASIFDNIPNSIFVKDAQELRFVRVNTACETLTGYPEREILGKNDYDLFPKAQADFFIARDRETLAGKQQVSIVEETITSRDGTQKLLLTKKFSVLDKDGHSQYLLGMSEDITERKEQENRIMRLNRIQAMLSGINSAIVRIRDRQELLNEACRIAATHGAFRLAWFGLLNQATGEMDLVASAGFDDGFSGELTLANPKGTFGPRGVGTRALHEQRTFVDNDILANPDITSVRRDAINRGCRSVIGLPLWVEGATVGSLMLYAEDKDFFDAEEVKLLEELAGDISFGLEFIAKKEKVDYLAYHDALTGLANRRLFLERVAQYIRSAISGGHKLAVFILDLERFRNINDSLGRPAGDALLKQVSEFLSRDAEDPSMLARLGADHFAIVVPELKQEGNIANLLDGKMHAFLGHTFRLNDTELRIPIKVGGAIYPNDGTDADTLLQNAEAALKKAKASGDRYLFYAQKMTATVAGNLTLENQLRQALEKEEFVLHYQPKVNLGSGKLTGAEALIRWNDPRTGLVPPGRFIPVLEETGLIYDVGRWALRKAIEDYLRWRAKGLAAVRVAVNVSPLQLRHRDFLAEIKQAISIDAHAPAGLELEITESLIMEDVKNSIATLQAIRAMGLSIAIDDFGTGFSSLSYLSKLPVDTLKIDRSFVIDMTIGPEGLALVSTIINLAHSLKLKVVAEGVETEEQSRLLRLLDCDEMQGFLFSKPIPGEVFEKKYLSLISDSVAL